MAKPSRTIKPSTRNKKPDIDPMLQGIPHANDFRRKIEFIRSVVKEWLSHGGIGISDTTPEGRLRWKGHREKVHVKVPYKHVWVTIGGQGSDERKTAWFDPKKPDEITPDVEM